MTHCVLLLSTYQVVVEEESGRKLKRELGMQECFPVPTSHGEAQARGAPHYCTAEMPPSSLAEATPFTVGDNHTYNGYWNSPLDPRKNYLIYFQAMSNFRGVSEQPLCHFLGVIFKKKTIELSFINIIYHYFQISTIYTAQKLQLTLMNSFIYMFM